MLTASEANSIARQILLSKVEPYISVVAEKIGKAVMDGCCRVGYEFSGDEVLHMEDIITYLKLIGYDVKISNSHTYVTILW